MSRFLSFSQTNKLPFHHTSDKESACTPINGYITSFLFYLPKLISVLFTEINRAAIVVYYIKIDCNYGIKRVARVSLVLTILRPCFKRYVTHCALGRKEKCVFLWFTRTTTVNFTPATRGPMFA